MASLHTTILSPTMDMQGPPLLWIGSQPQRGERGSDEDLPRPPSYSIRIGEGEPDIGRGPLHSDEPGDSACTHHPF